MSTNPNLYNEHIFAIAHELRSPLAVMNSNTYNQLNMLRKLYHSIEHNSDNINIIKKLKDSILIVESQINNIEDFISRVSEYGLYNDSPDDTKVLIHMKSYTEQLISIAPSFSRSMNIFGEDGICYGDTFGIDFENVHVVVNPQDLNRIVMNICTNAADAVTQVWKHNKIKSNYFPTLKLRCIKSSSPEKSIIMNNKILGPVGCDNKDCPFYLVIEDNGPGISKENLDHIFTYGFSTKKDKTKNHLGFGLHMCMQLAKKNNLSIFIDTNKNGTKFFIGFPDMIVSKPENLNKDLDFNSYIGFDDYSILNFSVDSTNLYKDCVEKLGNGSDKYKTLNEDTKGHDPLRVFDPKNKNN